MKILIISDIHANLTALEAVLAHASGYDSVWCLGDLVGYGPDPNECIETVRSLPNLICLIGNHDAAVLDMIDANAFNAEARAVVNWTKSILTAENHAFIASKPSKTITEDITLAHASPRYPVWEYLLDTYTARVNFEHFTTDFCLVGHTHVPVIYHLSPGNGMAMAQIPAPNTCFRLPVRAIANPGSVGQPRDRDPRAAYVLFDPEYNLWDYHRIPYDISAVQARMQKIGLPDRHIRRLAAGW